MSLALDDLPRDPERLLQQLRYMDEVIAAERSRNTALEIERDTVLAERDAAQAEIEKLRLLIRQLQRGRFGRRSEKLDPDQLQLGLEDLEQAAALRYHSLRHRSKIRTMRTKTPAIFCGIGRRRLRVRPDFAGDGCVCGRTSPAGERPVSLR